VGNAQPLEVELLDVSSLKTQDRDKVVAFQMKLGQLQQDVTAAMRVISTALQQVEQAKAAIADTRQAPLQLVDQFRQLELKLIDARESLTGDPTKPRREAVGAPSVAGRIQTALYGSMGNLYGITKTQRQQAEIAAEEYQAAYDTIRKLTESELPKLLKKLDAAGVPWTDGRDLPEKPKK
jgi:hypothetical protein